MKQQQVIQKKQKIRQKIAQHTRKSQVPDQIQDHPYLQAQGIIGNHGMLRRHSGVIQAKLKVSSPGDKYEQEADRVAEQVMRMPDRSLMEEPKTKKETAIWNNSVIPNVDGLFTRQTGESRGQESKLKPFWVKDLSPLNSALHAVEAPEATAVLSTPGQPLSESLRTFFEPRFGCDFRHVRVHMDEGASALATAVSARAFTVGQDIWFARGQFSPETAAGRKLFAHELAHFVQQSGIQATSPSAPAVVQRKPIPETVGGLGTLFWLAKGKFFPADATRYTSTAWSTEISPSGEGWVTIRAGRKGVVQIYVEVELKDKGKERFWFDWNVVTTPYGDVVVKGRKLEYKGPTAVGLPFMFDRHDIKAEPGEGKSSSAGSVRLTPTLKLWPGVKTSEEKGFEAKVGAPEVGISGEYKGVKVKVAVKPKEELRWFDKSGTTKSQERIKRPTFTLRLSIPGAKETRGEVTFGRVEILGYNVYFEKDKDVVFPTQLTKLADWFDSLSPETQDQIIEGKILVKVKGHASRTYRSKVLPAGHPSEKRSFEYNWNLSDRRAKETEKALIKIAGRGKNVIPKISFAPRGYIKCASFEEAWECRKTEIRFEKRK